MSSTATPPARKITSRLFTRATVSEVERATARMRRIRLAGSGLASLSPLPGQQLRVVVNDLFSREALRHMFRDVLRTYSVWDHDPRAGTVDLCVLDLGDGPGARWSRQARAGDQVSFSGPEGKFTLQQAAYHLFVGEETAQVAFGAMLRALPPQASVHGVIEVNEEADRLPFAHGEAVSWLSRHGASAERSATLAGALRSLDLPPEPGHAYIAGEAKTCAAARRHLIDDRGWPARSISAKPFWTPGKRGLE
ncbi:MAG: siderophore-interacting protein [Trebonia sp.]